MDDASKEESTSEEKSSRKEEVGTEEGHTMARLTG
jgi:hypothetical protein